MSSNVDPTSLASWRELLAGCRATQQVVTLSNEYISKVPSEELLHLPEECKPRFFRNAADLSAYAVDLKMCRCRDLRETQVVEKLAAFFQDASQRLSVLTGPHRLIGPSFWNSPSDRP